VNPVIPSYVFFHLAARADHERNMPQREIDATDEQIDQLVYELYGLTEDEAKTIAWGAQK
jgi:hypothetical protein